MAISDPTTRRIPTGWIVAGAVLVVALAVLIWWGNRPPPQMGSDPAVFDTVDALFTAVTSRDVRRLGECEERLRGFREAGTLPAKSRKAETPPVFSLRAAGDP